ncbi:hypothetical protein [Roseibium sp.]|uniref:hypothetical protein n=1 Tax=Roseibium sp. TaxID=1936156 RepID=UPI003A96F769
MKIAMICGSWPPERCGIGDYSEALCRALEVQNVEIIRIRRDNWHLTSALSYRAQLRASRADIHHVQYPAVGYGRSILPALTPYLLSSVPSAVTLHEYEIFKAYRKPWFAPYARKSLTRIFSRTAERDAFAAAFPRRVGTDHILPIGSNIPVATTDASREKGSIVFFGLFWPGKGLEDFLELARLLRANGQSHRRLSILGAPVAGQEAFAAHLRKETGRLAIDLHEGLPADEVATFLSKHEYAYLPFPDGADERRGTLAAALVNGCIPITRHGPATPDWLKAATLPADTPLSASVLFSGPTAVVSDKSYLEKPIAAAAARYDWAEIAQKHIEIYETLLNE